MRSRTDIEERIRFLFCAELTRRVEEAETRLPHLCRHNHRQPLDTRKTVEDMPNDSYNRTADQHGLPVVQTIGLCMLGSENPEQWPGNICEDPIDAQRCPYFDPSASKESIYQLFKDNVSDVEWVRAHMPELYGLLWALDGRSPSLPLWKQIWFKMLRIHVEPLRPIQETVNLLPPAPGA